MMKRDEIFEKIVEICRDVFENDELLLTEQTSREDVEAWDSLSHLNLISDIQDEFDITMTLEEISESKNIGKLVDVCMKYLQ